ncbi:hypothetical protein NE237_026736 [Protea cynaroides]|uniref:Uncharacterized protein n=1 Tax=Protea cynaroides TaxID=273540 RepID=A0A9Q0GL85_9MAGN|nr:hypothetical protein NE237_026736 [Protea cynaroides]
MQALIASGAAKRSWCHLHKEIEFCRLAAPHLERIVEKSSFRVPKREPADSRLLTKEGFFTSCKRSIGARIEPSQEKASVDWMGPAASGTG